MSTIILKSIHSDGPSSTLPLNSTALVSSGQEAKQVLPWYGPVQGETCWEPPVHRLRQWEETHTGPSQGLTTSGRKQRQNAVQGGIDKPASSRYIHTKLLNLKKGSSTQQVTQQTRGEGALHGEKGHCTGEAGIVHTVLFWVGLSVVCNLYGYNKLHA